MTEYAGPLVADSPSTWLRERFCPLPWTLAEIHSDGSVYVCCPRYSDGKKIGNIFTDSPMEIWNSETAQKFRAGILDGDFAMCHPTLCPSLAGRDLPKREATHDPYLNEVIAQAAIVAPRGPRHVKLAHDDSCNLSCPSCRDRMIVAKSDRQRELDRILKTFILPFLKDCASIELAGDGDPFASKHYRDILLMTAETYPHLGISLHTNAVLCDEDNWERLKLGNRVHSVLVSIDAAREQTYRIVRRGGDWGRLTENLALLREKRRAGRIRKLTLAFVVQGGNFREMAEFVALGKDLGVDAVSFSLIYPWGRANLGPAFGEMQIWSPDHPEHVDFFAVLRDPIFADPIVSLGDVAVYRDARAGN